MITPTSLYTDHYELTMIQAALASGQAHRRSVFEVFGRRLPGGRRYGVVAGTGRFLEALAGFTFTTDDIDFLRSSAVVDEVTAQWLSTYRFTGNIWGYAEGDIYFPSSPLMVVESTFAEGVVLETLLLSILNHDSAVATAASRMTAVANGRPCLEMGSRRTHEEAAVAAARAAYIAGFDATSNLRAGQRYGVPTIGTSAHSFTLLYDTEEEAFRSQMSSLGHGTTLLVDTYDIDNAVRAAVDLAGPNLGAVRLDSGDLLSQAQRVRSVLDELGAHATKIVVTSDLDEYAIAALQSAPVDGYGVGTNVVTGSGHPAAGLVYKLVSREGRDGHMKDVAKTSSQKKSVGGRKFALRQRDASGVAQRELVGLGGKPAGDSNDRNLLVPLVVDGEIVANTGAETARSHHRDARRELPAAALRLSQGDPILETQFVENLEENV